MSVDSKFTNYQNLAKLDENGINFLTIRRRGKKIIEEIRYSLRLDTLLPILPIYLLWTWSIYAKAYLLN